MSPRFVDSVLKLGIVVAFTVAFGLVGYLLRGC